MGRRIEFESGERILGTRLCYVEERPAVAKRRQALFLCDCGSTVVTALNWVRFGDIKSCGCYKRELVTEKNSKHGHAERANPSGVYRSWQAMHQRVKANPLYADRHICDRWSGEDGFANFLADMGERPEAHSIERRENDKGYEPSNCIWATKAEQARNTSTCRYVTIEGQTKTIQEWCRTKGIRYGLVKERRQSGLSLEEALTRPLDESKRRVRVV